MNPGAKKIFAVALGHACLWCLGLSAVGQQAQPEAKHHDYAILVTNEEGEEICRLPIDILH